MAVAVAGCAAGLGGAIGLNLHYPIVGGSCIEGLFTSPLLSLGNRLWRRSTRKKMTKEGIPEPSSTIEYAPDLLMDVFDFRCSREGAAPVCLYFHSGSFCMGGREFGAGTLSWLAEFGFVCISVGYSLTSSSDGLGLAGSISSAWMALRYVRSHAAELGIDTSKIVVIGDSAGGTLALSLATGLRGGDEGSPAPIAERPAAAIIGWGCCTVGSKTYFPVQMNDGSWGETPAASDLECQNVFVPAGKGKTAADTQRHIQKVIGGMFLAFGRRAKGWLPASAANRWPSDDGMSVSPLSLASRPGMPPTLMLIGGSDEVVPASQQLMFADVARNAGNKVGALVFEGAKHGFGGTNSSAGREAVMRFFSALGVPCERREGAAADPQDYVRSAVRVFGLDKQAGWEEYQSEVLDTVGTGWLDGSETLYVRKPAASKSEEVGSQSNAVGA